MLRAEPVRADRAGRFRRKPVVAGEGRTGSVRTVLLWALATLLAFVVVEASIFRSGRYSQYLEPDSAAGAVEAHLFWLKQTPPAKTPEVLVVGDSRIGEGFSAPEAAHASGNRIVFWNFGIPGTTPRAWYYMLRDADPTRRRFAAITLALDHYADEDTFDGVEDHLGDVSFVIERLRLNDCLDFASSMNNPVSEHKALMGCLFRGLTLRRDVQEFMTNIRGRIRRAKDWRTNGLRYVSGYTGNPDDLRGVSADFVRRTISFPPGVDPQRQKTVREMVIPPPAPQTGEATRYRERWLGRILDLYKDSPARIIFLELPRAPLPKPQSRVPARFLESALRRPRIAALPSDTFHDLERPDFFFDGLHLNDRGRHIFSVRLGERTAALAGVE
jgi:hypothetical protein